jgi:hypothetical protein
MAAGPVAAQQALPDPVSVSVPDLSGSADEAVVKNGWKYFLYHRPATSFADAYADIADCTRYLAPAAWSDVGLPRFIPWVETPATRRDKRGYINNQYGVVGVVIGGMVEGTLVRRDRQSKMRRCMEPRGYTRYGVAETVWENITAMPPERAIAVQAKIASGPLWGGKEPSK